MKQADLETGMEVQTKDGRYAIVVWPAYCHPYSRLACVRLPNGETELVVPKDLRPAVKALA